MREQHREIISFDMAGIQVWSCPGNNIIRSKIWKDGKAMGKYRCLCCGCRTLYARGEYDICPVCYWEDERYPYIKNNVLYVLGQGQQEGDGEYDGTDVLDLQSGANHGLTLRQGRENYRKFGACEEGMIVYVRKPFEEELEEDFNLSEESPASDL